MLSCRDSTLALFTLPPESLNDHVVHRISTRTAAP